MRVLLSQQSREFLFGTLEQKTFKLGDISQVLGVSKRTVFDWERGKYTIPIKHFNKLLEVSELTLDEIQSEILPMWWANSIAGRRGSLIRTQRYGSLGTLKSRQKGGKQSYLKRKDLPGSIYTPTPIKIPLPSESLAEFFGILIGDGGVSKYQVIVTTNSIDDVKYGQYVADLVERLFGISPALSKRKDSNCLKIVASSKRMVNFLKERGILEGHKIRQGLDIPQWILADKRYVRACLRGIFDTDGGIFLERHLVKGKVYSYPRMSFVSLSSNLRTTLQKVLAEMGFDPRIRNNRSVNLETSRDIRAYFQLIGTSNPKHFTRYKRFGGVG